MRRGKAFGRVCVSVYRYVMRNNTISRRREGPSKSCIVVNCQICSVSPMGRNSMCSGSFAIQYLLRNDAVSGIPKLQHWGSCAVPY